MSMSYDYIGIGFVESLEGVVVQPNIGTTDELGYRVVLQMRNGVFRPPFTVYPADLRRAPPVKIIGAPIGQPFMFTIHAGTLYCWIKELDYLGPCGGAFAVPRQPPRIEIPAELIGVTA